MRFFLENGTGFGLGPLIILLTEVDLEMPQMERDAKVAVYVSSYFSAE
jgi:hypothetical protein